MTVPLVFRSQPHRRGWYGPALSRWRGFPQDEQKVAYTLAGGTGAPQFPQNATAIEGGAALGAPVGAGRGCFRRYRTRKTTTTETTAAATPAIRPITRNGGQAVIWNPATIESKVAFASPNALNATLKTMTHSRPWAALTTMTAL